eukprot:gene23259-29472_t
MILGLQKRLHEELFVQSLDAIISGESDAYELGTSKEIRRQEIATSLSSDVMSAEPSRLLSLLSQAMKFQQSNKLVVDGVVDAPYDLFCGRRKVIRKDTTDSIVRRACGLIALSKGARIECAASSPDGQSIVTGSSDGYIEVWDADTYSLRGDLLYQAKGESMMQDGAVMCCAFAKDGDQLATGNQLGEVKIWKVSSGVCVRKIVQAHPRGITSLCFARDSTQLLTTSYDQTARIHGLKSGKTLKEFRGHTSFVNVGLYLQNSTNHIMTASADGTVKHWDIRSTECIMTCRPGSASSSSASREVGIVSMEPVPFNAELVLVCTKDSAAYLVHPNWAAGRLHTTEGKCSCGPNRDRRDMHLNPPSSSSQHYWWN